MKLQSVGALIRSLLAHPLARGLDVDDARLVSVRRRILKEKPFLERLYRDWYAAVVASLPDAVGRVVELGSGAGFLHEAIDGLIRSDVVPGHGIDVALDARSLPFAESSLKAIVMTDVFHHIPDVECFLHAADRCLAPGGRIIMWEPWVTSWSRFVYSRLHHEPFDPDAREWSFRDGSPLGAANGALPWIVLVRDRDRFDERFPGLRVEKIEPGMPVRYLLSGGVSMRSLAPGWSYGAVSIVENMLSRFAGRTGMLALIVIAKRGDADA